MIYWLLACLFCLSPLAAQVKILAIAGSTRDASHNKKLLAEAARIARDKGAAVTIVDLSDYPMPFYDADLEKRVGMPPHAKKLRQMMVESDAVMISSPEYNHSISAVLKNALDWCSRAEDGGGSREAFAGKKFALMSASPGKKGGKKGLIHLRDVIEELHGTIVETQVCVGRAGEVHFSKDLALDHRLEREIAELLSQD